QEPPLVVLEAAGALVEARPSRQGQVVILPVVSRGWWRSDLDLNVHSETFHPGPQDPRPLGVRVQAVRLVPDGPLVWPRRPPLDAPIVAAATVLLLFRILVRRGSSPERAFRWGIALA